MSRGAMAKHDLSSQSGGPAPTRRALSLSGNGNVYHTRPPTEAIVASVWRAHLSGTRGAYRKALAEMFVPPGPPDLDSWSMEMVARSVAIYCGYWKRHPDPRSAVAAAAAAAAAVGAAMAERANQQRS